MLLRWFRNLCGSRVSRPASARSRAGRCRPSVETLENRTLLSATVEMGTLTRTDSTHLQYIYQVANGPASFAVNFYRSSDATHDASDIAIGTDSVVGAVDGQYSRNMTLTAGFAPDPAHKFILAVATGVTSTDDTAALRTYILGVVTHGDAPTGQFPTWVPYVASQLQGLNYDATIAYDWSKIAFLPASGTAQLAADLLTAKVLATIAQSGAPQGAWDLQMIGHSRGASVISLSMQQLISLHVPQLAGYKRLTYLDAHPANAGTDNLFNYSTLKGHLGYRAAIKLQQIINDPPAFVPAGVDYAESYYQQGLAAQVLYQKLEAVLNLWGQSNLTLAAHTIDLTVPGMSHTGVWRVYSRLIVQSLATALPGETTFAPVIKLPDDLRPLPIESSVGLSLARSQILAQLRSYSVFLRLLAQIQIEWRLRL